MKQNPNFYAPVHSSRHLVLIGSVALTAGGFYTAWRKISAIVTAPKGMREA
jgi:hypothetical protein